MTKEREAEIRKFRRDCCGDDPRPCVSCQHTIDLLAEIDRLRAALQGMVDRFGICLTAIFPSGMQLVTKEMEARRCDRCPPCIARAALEPKS